MYAVTNFNLLAGNLKYFLRKVMIAWTCVTGDLLSISFLFYPLPEAPAEQVCSQLFVIVMFSPLEWVAWLPS